MRQSQILQSQEQAMEKKKQSLARRGKISGKIMLRKKPRKKKNMHKRNLDRGSAARRTEKVRREKVREEMLLRRPEPI